MSRTSWLWVAGAAVLAGVIAVVIHIATRSEQASLSADTLPLPAAAVITGSYTDCDDVTILGPEPHWPCETFALVQSLRHQPVGALLAAQAARLKAAGSRRSSSQSIDFDDYPSGRPQPSAIGWVAPRRGGCAVVLTLAEGLAVETESIFRPYDPYNQPQGLVAFDHAAQRVDYADTLWVRLIPDNNGYYNRTLC